MPSYKECESVFAIISRTVSLSLLDEYCIGFVNDHKDKASKCRLEVRKAYKLLSTQVVSCKDRVFHPACKLFDLNSVPDKSVLDIKQENLLNNCRDSLYEQQVIIDKAKKHFESCQIMHQCVENYQVLNLTSGDTAVVNRIFRSFSKVSHPDMFPDPEQKKITKEKYSLVQSSYNFLKVNCTELDQGFVEEFAQSVIGAENIKKAEADSESSVSKAIRWGVKTFYYYYYGLDEGGIALVSGRSLGYNDDN